MEFNECHERCFEHLYNDFLSHKLCKNFVVFVEFLESVLYACVFRYMKEVCIFVEVHIYMSNAKLFFLFKCVYI